IGKFVEMVNAWTGEGSFMGASVSTTLHELVERVITESGLEAYYKKQAKASGADADGERLDNLSELITSARDFEREYDPANDPASFTDEESAKAGDLGDVPPLLAMLRAYLESIALVADGDAVDPSQGAVTLMTLHASKGLEFHAVAMIALEEGTLPHSRANESLAELEEERRLAFVGITRAMKHLHITTAKRRTIRGMTERTISSRFLGEIGSESVIFTDQSSEYSYCDDDDDIRTTRDSTSVGGPRFNDASSTRESTREKIDAARDLRRDSQAAHHNAAAEFPTGCAVRHPQFGPGTIVKVTAGANARAVVHFESVGKKTLVLEYARLKRI
ncbi:MAG: ATP-binding domain-containing protein, partial [Phycisphaerales bacterium]|nr:ATP-binding domain-containing protein [Phycisphaerales bacterium]